MKIALLLALMSGLYVQTTSAQNATADIILAKERARANESNAAEKAARQDDGSSSSSASAPTPVNTPPPPPARPNSREQAVAKLKADIAMVRSKGVATAEMKAQFAKDLMAAALGSSQPSMATLTKFSESLLPILAAKGVAPTCDARVMQDLMVALNSHGLSTTRMGEIADEVKAALDKAGADAAATGAVAENMKAIAADIQGGGAK